MQKVYCATLNAVVQTIHLRFDNFSRTESETFPHIPKRTQFWSLSVCTNSNCCGFRAFRNLLFGQRLQILWKHDNLSFYNISCNPKKVQGEWSKGIYIIELWLCNCEPSFSSIKCGHMFSKGRIVSWGLLCNKQYLKVLLTVHN